jgi:hypothetical protein
VRSRGTRALDWAGPFWRMRRRSPDACSSALAFCVVTAPKVGSTGWCTGVGTTSARAQLRLRTAVTRFLAWCPVARARVRRTQAEAREPEASNNCELVKEGSEARATRLTRARLSDRRNESTRFGRHVGEKNKGWRPHAKKSLSLRNGDILRSSDI